MSGFRAALFYFVVLVSYVLTVGLNPETVGSDIPMVDINDETVGSDILTVDINAETVGSDIQTVEFNGETVDIDIPTVAADGAVVERDCRGGGSSPPAERSENERESKFNCEC